MGREALRLILRLAAQAPHRFRPLSSNVRRRNPHTVKQSIGLVSLVVPEYDEAIAFYVGVLGFVLIEDSFVPEQNKRWVVVAPPGATETRLLLARASSP